jgi:hypothetical protein
MIALVISDAREEEEEEEKKAKTFFFKKFHQKKKENVDRSLSEKNCSIKWIKLLVHFSTHIHKKKL